MEKKKKKSQKKPKSAKKVNKVNRENFVTDRQMDTGEFTDWGSNIIDAFHIQQLIFNANIM